MSVETAEQCKSSWMLMLSSLACPMNLLAAYRKQSKGQSGGMSMCLLPGGVLLDMYCKAGINELCVRHCEI